MYNITNGEDTEPPSIIGGSVSSGPLTAGDHFASDT